MTTPTTPQRDIARAWMLTEVLLEQAGRGEQWHAANLKDPGLGPALERTTALVDRADNIETREQDTQADIRAAHSRGLTLAQWQDERDAMFAAEN